MQAQDFVTSIIQAYHEARKPLHNHPRIERGRSRSISSEAEELLALLLAENVETIEDIFVDQPITLDRTGQRSLTRYPDIALMRPSPCSSPKNTC